MLIFIRSADEFFDGVRNIAERDLVHHAVTSKYATIAAESFRAERHT